jgi:hypothetical protein
METQTIQTNKIEVGDVFVTSWGYDQTNYDYIVVVELSPSGKTAICQLAEFETVGHSSQCNIQKPKAKGYGYKFRMKVGDRYNGEAGLRGSYPHCASQVLRLAEGEKPSMRLDGFSKVKEGETFWETDSMFGH